jgi:hypothetical protein
MVYTLAVSQSNGGEEVRLLTIVSSQKTDFCMVIVVSGNGS